MEICINIHPSISLIIFLVKGHEDAGANPSSHWARGRVDPVQVASLSQDCCVKVKNPNFSFSFFFFSEFDAEQFI